MPEGHSVHRIARQFDRNFVGHARARIEPAGPVRRGRRRARRADAMTVPAPSASRCSSSSRTTLWLRVHLGMYGAWDFAGEILVDATIASANGRMGQTNQRGTFLDGPNPDAVVFDAAGENSLTSIGAPRRTRLRMSESEKEGRDGLDAFPPGRSGRCGVRLLTDTTAPTCAARPRARCSTPHRSRPSSRSSVPTRSSTTAPRPRSGSRAVVRRKPTPIGCC